jgi:hypothetical protein
MKRWYSVRGLLLLTRAVDAVADAGGLGALAMKLVPVRLIAKDLSLLTVQELRQLG